jgi:hypothetical protein
MIYSIENKQTYIVAMIEMKNMLEMLDLFLALYIKRSKLHGKTIFDTSPIGNI